MVQYSSLGKYFLYFTLFCAALNDMLRIPGTTVTLFRMIVVFSVLYCLKINWVSFKYFFWLVIILLINIFQSMTYADMNTYGIEFSIEIFLWNSYFYFCIVSIVVIMDTLAYKDECFVKRCGSLVFWLAYIYLLFLWMILIVPDAYTILTSYNVLSNMNNIGAYIAVIYSIFLYKAINDKDFKSLLFCVMSLLVLILLGRKLVTTGILIETVYIFLISDKYNAKVIWWGVGGVFCYVFIYFFDYELIEKIYKMLDVVITTAEYIYDEHVYEKIQTSQTFRVGVFVYGIQEIINSNFVGIGIGNTAYLLRMLMPMGDYMLKGDGAVSSHNFVIQLVLEFGFIAILFGSFVAKKVLNVLMEEKKNIFHYTFISIMLSIWIWLLAPSGFYTVYYVYIVLGYIILAMNRCKNQQ